MQQEREAKERDRQPAAEGVLSETHGAAHADILLLLRFGFCDAALSAPARRALVDAATRLGIPENQLADVLSPLEAADGRSLRVLADLDKPARLRLLGQAIDAVALDAGTAARGERLRARLMLLLDLVPADLSEPKAV